jgi:MerR family transcriptional regulator/heat shock protein HspR
MTMNDEPVYVISVVSRMLQLHPQTLRKYERAGPLRPSRTEGMLRLYSDDDVRRLRLIKHLVDDLGLNLAGVELVLGLRDRMEQMRRHLVEIDERSVEAFDEELDELLATLERDEVKP